MKQVSYILKLESKLPDPPAGSSLIKANALRASAIILLVSAFEFYLKAVFTEFADRVNFVLANEETPIPSDLQDSNGLSFIQYINNFKGPRSDRLAALRSASSMIASSSLYADAFGDTRASPKPDTVKGMFESIGATNVWPTIALNFTAAGHTTYNEYTITQTLLFVCNTRNEAVHAGLAVSISRAQLHQYVIFFDALALSVDQFLRSEFRRRTS